MLGKIDKRSKEICKASNSFGVSQYGIQWWIIPGLRLRWENCTCIILQCFLSMKCARINMAIVTLWWKRQRVEVWYSLLSIVDFLICFLFNPFSLNIDYQRPYRTSSHHHAYIHLEVSRYLQLLVAVTTVLITNSYTVGRLSSVTTWMMWNSSSIEQALQRARPTGLYISSKSLLNLVHLYRGKPLTSSFIFSWKRNSLSRHIWYQINLVIKERAIHLLS